MNCSQHTEIAATAFCRECGRPMCGECRRPALGSVYCEDHVPVTSPPTVSAPPPSHDVPALYSAPAYTGQSYANPPYATPPYATPPIASPYTAAVVPGAPDQSVHPVLALLLGFIPGVGAIYNGQYAKGLVHAIVFALLVSATVGARTDGMTIFAGIMIGAWVFYMIFEAYHTARKRRYGVAVEEFSGQFDFRAGNGRFPVGAILLMGLGFVLLLDTTGIISIEDFGKYWPVGLILLGVYLLYNRLNPEHPALPHDSAAKDAEVRR